MQLLKSLQIVNDGEVMENRMETPLKTKNKLPYDPSIPLLDIYLKEALIWKDTCIPIFIATLFTIVKRRNQPKCPLTDEWKRKKVVHIYNGIFKGRDITLLTKVHLVKAMGFPVDMYQCESWTIKKSECQRIDVFELWCWRRFLRVSWTERIQASQS